MSTPRSPLLPRLLAGALIAACAGASAQPSTPVERRLHEEVQAVLLRLIESGELAPAQADELAVTAQASQQADFGAILDARYRAESDSGLPVLGVSPGGSAAQLGVKPGDRVLAVNGVSLQGLGADTDGRSLALARLRAELVANPDEIELSVLRNDAVQVLRGAVRVVELPAYRLELGAAIGQAALAATGSGDAQSGCARITTFDVAPRSRQLYGAVLIAVDGRLPGPSTSDMYRVSPGHHVLTVAEDIAPHRFRLLQLQQRSRLGDERYKKIEVDIEAGITYRLAAQFHPEASEHVREGTYWDPVLWKQFPERCR